MCQCHPEYTQNKYKRLVSNIRFQNYYPDGSRRVYWLSLHTSLQTLQQSIVCALLFLLTLWSENKCTNMLKGLLLLFQIHLVRCQFRLDILINALQFFYNLFSSYRRENIYISWKMMRVGSYCLLKDVCAWKTTNDTICWNLLDH